MPQISNDEIAKDINSLNSTQREVFNVVHTWAWWAWCWTSVHISFRQWRDRKISFCESDIPHHIKNIALSCEASEKPRAPLLGPTGISAVNTGGTTIHYGLRIKPGTKLLVLNDKSKAALKNRLSEVKLNKRWTFYDIKWFMDRLVGRNIHNDSRKSISWSFSMTVADLGINYTVKNVAIKAVFLIWSIVELPTLWFQNTE